MSKDLDKILDKVKKCLALSKSSEPHEAAAALRQAQKLMAAHGISESTIKFSDIGEQRVKSKFSVSRMKDYELSLVRSIANAFGCKILWQKSHSNCDDSFAEFILVGVTSKIQLAKYTCDVMLRKLVSAKSKFSKNLPENYSRKTKTYELDGFCHGWVSEVIKTVIEFSNCQDTQNLINDYLDEKLGKHRKISTVQSRSIGLNGLNAGKLAGSSESIQRPINKEKQIMIGAK